MPRRLPVNADTLALAANVIALFRGAQGRTRGELEAELQVLEGDRTDYRIKRGLAHLLASDFSTFEVSSPVEPSALRRRVFALSAVSVPSPQQSRATLTAVADGLSHELGRDISPPQVRAWLYADLPEAHLLISFEAPTPESLLQRYDLAQAQGVLYRASHVIITAHRNDPGEYKLLFRYLKLFGLMAYIEGDADHGFTLSIDGPASLFTPSPRYGLALAKLLPALLHVTRWGLTATLVPRQGPFPISQGTRFTLESGCGLVSHYPPGKPYDSILEQAFAARWAKTPTAWRLEREVDLVPLPGSVMVPDFRLVHPDGRSCLLELVGYWRPEYLRKKFAQVRRAGRSDVILAVSERLNLERAGVTRGDIPVRVVWFKDRLLPKAVLDVLEASGDL
jgi:predicted nuclease of restriction endonuclease-like RecB superfamily